MFSNLEHWSFYQTFPISPFLSCWLFFYKKNLENSELYLDFQENVILSCSSMQPWYCCPEENIQIPSNNKKLLKGILFASVFKCHCLTPSNSSSKKYFKSCREHVCVDRQFENILMLLMFILWCKKRRKNSANKKLNRQKTCSPAQRKKTTETRTVAARRKKNQY